MESGPDNGLEAVLVETLDHDVTGMELPMVEHVRLLQKTRGCRACQEVVHEY